MKILENIKKNKIFRRINKNWINTKKNIKKLTNKNINKNPTIIILKKIINI